MSIGHWQQPNGHCRQSAAESRQCQRPPGSSLPLFRCGIGLVGLGRGQDSEAESNLKVGHWQGAPASESESPPRRDRDRGICPGPGSGFGRRRSVPRRMETAPGRVALAAAATRRSPRPRSGAPSHRLAVPGRPKTQRPGPGSTEQQTLLSEVTLARGTCHWKSRPAALAPATGNHGFTLRDDGQGTITYVMKP